MNTYQYKAQLADGSIKKGIVEATDEYDAAVRIKTNYPIIISLKQVESTPLTGFFSQDIGGNRINVKNLSVICSQIAITLKSGVPIARCLDLIGRQTEDKKLRKVLLSTAEDVSEGNSLADSLQRNGPGLPNTFIETIRAGEESGNIENSFGEMAVYYEKAYKTSDKIKAALAYPIFVICVAIVVLIIVMAFVMPTLADTFKSLGGDLPAMTKAMIAMSEFFQKWWVVMLIVLVAAALFITLYGKTEKGALQKARMMLKMPIFGKINVMTGASQFASTMAMLLKSGITVNHAIEITSATLTNAVLGKEVAAMKVSVEEGRPLGECIRKCEDFPSTLIEMCAIGEETGELDSTLSVIGEFYDNEASTATAKVIARMEPTILVCLAIFAGFIVISIYLPMFTMYNLM